MTTFKLVNPHIFPYHFSRHGQPDYLNFPSAPLLMPYASIFVQKNKKNEPVSTKGDFPAKGVSVQVPVFRCRKKRLLTPAAWNLETTLQNWPMGCGFLRWHINHNQKFFLKIHHKKESTP
ncbi:MAG: hypothetical protein R2874_10250 [Desulfobacterales bacterium]